MAPRELKTRVLVSALRDARDISTLSVYRLPSLKTQVRYRRGSEKQFIAVVCLFLVACFIGTSMMTPGVFTHRVTAKGDTGEILLASNDIAFRSDFFRTLMREVDSIYSSRENYLKGFIGDTYRTVDNEALLAKAIVKESKRANADPFFIAAVIDAERLLAPIRALRDLCS
jgi:hypothetical protein